MKIARKIAALIAPLLLFVMLLAPYLWVNQAFLVDWLGCGCPVIDESGNVIKNNFNANDFTALFWLLVSLCATALAVWQSRKIPKEKLWLRAVYVLGILALSLLISHRFYYIMLWE